MSRANALIFGIYKKAISPALHAVGFTNCKYLPTCSEYALVALERFGPVRGSWMALKRLVRCHPWSEGGFDPVPAAGNDGVPQQQTSHSHSSFNRDLP